MTALAVLIATIGGILVLVGLVGGGFTFSGSVMPRVGRFARIPCFIVGAVLLITGIAVGLTGSGPGPGPHTFNASVVVPNGYSYDKAFQLPSLNSQVMAQFSNDESVQIVCTAEGESVTNNGLTSSLWDKTSSGYLPDVDLYTGTDQPTMPNC